MRLLLPPAFAVAFALLAALPARAQTVTADQAWARATAPRAEVGGAYLTLRVADAPDRLVGGSTPVAAKVEIHEHIHDNGVMRMRPVAGGIALEPGKPVALVPGGYHVMLIGLTQQLKPGERFPLTLAFAKAAPVTVTVTVGTAGASAPPAQGHSH
jgi:copper(I)-binding protein